MNNIMNKEKFLDLKNQWWEDTKFLSDINEMNKHESVAEFIKAGEEILPLIFNDIKNETNTHWFYVLQSITGVNPVPKKHRGYIQTMNRDWVIWYNEIYLKEIEHLKYVLGKHYLLNNANLKYYPIEPSMKLRLNEEHTVSYWIIENTDDISNVKIIEIEDEFCGTNPDYQHTLKDNFKFVNFLTLDEISKNLFAVGNEK